MTVLPVADGQKRKPSQEELLTYFRREVDFRTRFLDGALNPAGALQALQQISEGNIICPKWDMRDGFLCFTATSNGCSGVQWAESLGDLMNKEIKWMLGSEQFVPTNGITYQAVVLQKPITISDKELFEADAIARMMKFERPPLELACLAAKLFDYEDIRHTDCSQLVFGSYVGPDGYYKRVVLGEGGLYCSYRSGFFDYKYGYVYLSNQPS